MEQPSTTPNTATPAAASRLEGAELMNKLKKQLSYYFSNENLATDRYLLGQMNQNLYVPIKTIAGFKMVKNLTYDAELVAQAFKEIDSVVVDETGSMVRPNIKLQRQTILLREIPTTVPVEELQALFNNEKCPKVKEIRPDIEDTWYVTMEDDDSTKATVDFLSTLTFRDKPLKARLKTENTLRLLIAAAQTAAASSEATNPYFYNNNGNQDSRNERRDGRDHDSRRNRNYGNGGNRRNRSGSKGRDNNQGNRKRKDSVGKDFQISTANFPPLPTQKVGGYPSDFQKYSREQIVEVISQIKSVSRPAELPAESVVLKEANTQLLASKPWPVKKVVVEAKEEKKEEAVKVDEKKEESSSAAAATSVESKN